METSIMGILAQASDLPNTIKPWQENWVIDAILLGFTFLFILLIWLWARSGRSKRENELPFERTSEDFAGTVQAAYGRLPAFLIVLYVVVLVAIAAYVVNGIITGVKY
ncbi:MAG: hypothetical protein JWP00_1569 [Chloroflexi bacterium]|jgi:hypothetical protein|nr:hypothetical protein [Chloroflexota bacterium]